MKTSESFLMEIANTAKRVADKYNCVVDRLAVSQELFVNDVIITLVIRDMTDAEILNKEE